MKEYLTVSELNDYISSLLAADDLLYDCWIKGEISGCKVYQQSGHMYFSLKDRDAVISSVMFKSRVQKLKFVPEDGVEVLARGAVSVFSKQGKYQFYAQEMHVFGLGDLHWQLEKLKEKLQAKGYFAPDIKKPIPKTARRLGIVSSQDGAALRDILKILRHRAKNLEIIIAHSSVQGIDAPAEIAEAIKRLNMLEGVELIILARGGGSLEDLMAFNHEKVVEAVYHSKVPIISGIGHETDTTLADLAADLRAATPTQAAQLAVPDNTLILDSVTKNQQRLLRLMNRKLLNRSEQLDRIMMKKVWQQPESILKSKQVSLNDAEKNLENSMKNLYKDKAVGIEMIVNRLDDLSPLRIMQRGYALLQKENKIVRSTDDLDVGELVTIRLWKSQLQAQVVKKEKVDNGNQI